MRNTQSHAQDFEFHLEGLELVEDPDGLRVGAHFAKPVPPRKGKPGLWARWKRGDFFPLFVVLLMLAWVGAEYLRSQ